MRWRSWDISARTNVAFSGGKLTFAIEQIRDEFTSGALQTFLDLLPRLAGTESISK